MSPDELAPYFNRRPYLPVRLHLTEGESIDVRNPHMVVLGKTTIVIGIQRNIDSPYYDEPVMLALAHIRKVEPIIEAVPQPK